MSRRLDDLSARFRPLAVELLARCVEAGLPVTIIDTRRTPEEHQANLAAGTSWIDRSLHLDGDAIDLCPTVLLPVKGWHPASPLWAQLGVIGERVGCGWGGRWVQRDLGHFEWRAPTPASPTPPHVTTITTTLPAPLLEPLLASPAPPVSL